jgi:hypothetical protein
MPIEGYQKGALIPIPEARLMTPDLLIPGRKPISAASVRLNKALIKRHGVVAYYPILQGERRETTFNLGAVQDWLSQDQDQDFFLKSNAFLSPNGLVTVGTADRAENGNFISTILDGAKRVRLSIGFTFDSISSTQSENVLFNFIIDASLSGFLLDVNPSAQLDIWVRSSATDTPTTLNQATGTIVAGTKYDVDLEFDFENDYLDMYIDGYRVANNDSAGYNTSTYTKGTPTKNDAIGGDSGTKFSIGTIHYLVIYKDSPSLRFGSRLHGNPYQFLTAAI